MISFIDYKIVDDSKISMIILVITYLLSIQIINVLWDYFNKKNRKRE